MATTKCIIFARAPEGLPQADVDFRIEERQLPELKQGEILVKTLYLSVDPYMRGRMRPGIASYITSFKVGEPMSGGVVAEVTATQNERFKVGDKVSGMLDWSEQSVVSAESAAQLHTIPADSKAPLSYYLGVLGMPGLTSYFGLLDITNPKAGETVVVSGAAGAVGQLVGQIAKIKGCHVIGIAGSEDKIEYLKSIGFDAAINYKTTQDIADAIKQAAPKGVDVYFDNVGGTISDAVWKNLNRFARVSCCGAISSYNEKVVPVGPRREFDLVVKSIKQEGFIVSQWSKRYPEGLKQLAQWLAEGKIKYKETVREGLLNTHKAFIEMLQGENTGKMIVKA